MKCRVFKDFFSKAVLMVQLGAQGCKLSTHVADLCQGYTSVCIPLWHLIRESRVKT